MEKLKQRILTNWTFTRALYIGLGVFVIINSIIYQQWFGLIFGAYFASMGLFRFGCASGDCFGGTCNTESMGQTKSQIQNVEYEEVKSKL